jgi:peptidoglycan-N-acetylglucosamine deacetylase
MRRLLWLSFLVFIPLGFILAWTVSPWLELIWLVPVGLFVYATAKPGCQWWGPTMQAFPTRKREALISFDHSPDPVETPIVLNLLAEAEAQALFFVTGAEALRHPDLLKIIVERGHGLGIHSMTYDTWLAWRSAESIEAEVHYALDALQTVVPGVQVQWWRPATGCVGFATHAVAAKHKLQIMGWKAQDHSEHPRSFEDTVVALRRDIDQGAILRLTHGIKDKEGKPMLIDLLREMLLWLKGQGYYVGEE